MSDKKLLSEQVKEILKKQPLSEQFKSVETEEELKILESFESPDLPIVEYPSDESGHILIPSLKDWDE